MKNIKTFRKVKASIVNEKLKAKKPGDAITIDVDLDYDPKSNDPQDKASTKIFKKFKLDVIPNGATDVSFDLSGKKQDVINYLQSKYYEFDDEDIRDLYPELLERIDPAVGLIPALNKSIGGKKISKVHYNEGKYFVILGNGKYVMFDTGTRKNCSCGIPPEIGNEADVDWASITGESVEEGIFDKFKKKKAYDTDPGDPGWYDPIAREAMDRLKKHYEWKGWELAAMGPGNSKDYMMMAIYNPRSAKRDTTEAEFKVHFDPKTDKVKKIERVEQQPY